MALSEQTIFPRQNLLVALLSQMNDYIVLVCDAEGKIVSWHQPDEDVLGYNRSEIIGRSIDEILWTGAGPLSAQKPQSSLFDPRSPNVHWVVTSDGDKVLMSGVTLELQDAERNNTGSVRILRSVTSHKSSEINSRALIGALDQSNVLIRRWDGVVEHWSDGCEKLYGYTTAEALGRSAQDLLHTEYSVAVEKVDSALLNDGIWRGELKQRHKDGTSIFVSAQMVRLEAVTGQFPLVVCTHSDLTSRLHMQHELESANARLKLATQELERSNQELEEFARIASHDLSSPINSTRWMVEMLASRHGKQLDPSGQKALAQVGTSLERMSELVEAVLAHAQVGTSAIASIEPADTELALEVAMENLRRDITTTAARIQYVHLPPLYIGQQPLTQLFQNLVSNAIKYRRPEVAPLIKISADRDGANWRVCVHDNGMGVEPEWFERIFMPLQRRHSAKVAGSGIGLATCRKIVNRAGGRIWVESKVDVGSSFCFTLPGVPEDSESENERDVAKIV